MQQVAKVLQLDHLLERKPKELSGGQRQRVAIGRAIVQKPEVFLFDEPLSNLDASLRVQMRIEIARLHRELGATMIYVTHDQVEAMTLADRIVVFRAGQLEQVGTPTELYHEPINLFVAGFLGSPGMNFLSGTISSIGADGVQVALTGNQNVTVLVDAAGAKVGDAVTVGVRPEHLHVDLTSNILTGNAVVLERWVIRRCCTSTTPPPRCRCRYACRRCAMWISANAYRWASSPRTVICLTRTAKPSAGWTPSLNNL